MRWKKEHAHLLGFRFTLIGPKIVLITFFLTSLLFTLRFKKSTEKKGQNILTKFLP